MLKNVSFILFLISVLALMFQNVLGQNDINIPLPEYYGIYMIIDGKLCGVTVPTENCKVTLLDVIAERQQFKAIDYKKGIKFLIYQENPSQFVQKLELRPMLFARDFYSGSPTSTYRSSEKWSSWIYVNSESPEILSTAANLTTLKEQVQPIQFLIKPYKPNAVIAVPAKDLAAGLYTFWGTDLTGKRGFYFWTGDKVEGETSRCVDIEKEKFYGETVTTRFKPCVSGSVMQSTSSGAKPSIWNNEMFKKAVDPVLLKEFLAMENEMRAAGIQGNKQVFEKYLANNFTYTDLESKKTLDRSGYLSTIAKQEDYMSHTCKETETLSILGGDRPYPALARDCTYEKLSNGNQFTIRSTGFFWFDKINGSWKLVSLEVRDGKPKPKKKS